MSTATKTTDTARRPELRFPGFSNEWEKKKLGDIFTKKTKKNTNEIEKSVLTNSAIQGIVGQLDFFEKNIANQNNLMGYYLVDLDDFIYNPRISKHAPVGPLNRNNYKKGIISPLYIVLKPKIDFLDFIEKYFDTNKWNHYMCKIANYGARHDRMNISQGDFLQMPIPYPTLQEQKKIANFLNSVDEWINNLKSQKRNLETYKKGIMKKIFSQKIRFKDDNENDFPKWVEKEFNDLYDFGITNSLSREKLNYKFGNIYNIHYGDIHTKYKTQFVLNDEKVPYVNNLDSGNIDTKSLVKEGDIIIADASEDYNDIGKTIEIISTDNKKILSGLHTIFGKKTSDILFIGYVGHLMNSESMKLKMKKIAQGAKVLGLPKKYFKNLLMDLPTLPEQKKIANFLTSIDNLIESKQKQISKAEKWKKGLMQQLFI